uniref:Uncharacterized protein n=1 Tax=Arundo donax TaxID=35708 RepID=A0A0A9GI83_ARUDO
MVQWMRFCLSVSPLRFLVGPCRPRRFAAARVLHSRSLWPSLLCPLFLCHRDFWLPCAATLPARGPACPSFFVSCVRRPASG